MDKLLFTPGPLTTSHTVKEAMLHDLGSRDSFFISIVSDIRKDLLSVTHISQQMGYEVVLMQGSGTFGVEAVISSSIPKTGKLLVIVNGAYGERIARMAAIHSIPFVILACNEDELPDAEKAENLLIEGGFTHIVIVHCETTTGIINPIYSFGSLAKKYNLTYIVDSMSAFGAIPIDMSALNSSFLISSSNKCIEGVPGFSFVIATRDALNACKGQADTLSLDLYAQWAGLENDGQFRFTPPIQVLLAFKKAIDELKEEGGVEGRAERYRKNFNVLTKGMRALGFREYLSQEKQGYIINAFYYPEHPAFDFGSFYNKLNERGFLIYPGKLSKANCFRIGNIGRLYPENIEALIAAIGEVKEEMGF